jgi:hypothetical protein
MTAASISSCSDTTDAIGSSLVASEIEVIMDSAFTVSGRSILNQHVQSRTTTQLLGAITAPTYGELRGDYVAQLFPSNAIDTVSVGVENVDSVKISMVFDKDGFVGDSLIPMGVEIYPLVKQLPYPIYSDFDPTGYYDASNKLGSAAYTAAGIGVSDTVAASDYRYISVAMPLQMGRDIMSKYYENPALFNDPDAFAQYFPGLYVRSSFGSGRVSRITDTRWVMYYHKWQQLENSDGELVDSLTNHYAIYMASAPEVVSNTNINFKMAQGLDDLANAGHALIVTPAGRDVEITFPIKDVINSYRSQSGNLAVLNSLEFSVPADSIANGRGIEVPTTLLMVLSKNKEQFFADNDLPDDVLSFYGTYSSTDNEYVFDNMRSYMLEMMELGNDLTEEDYTFTLTPVTLITESSSYTTSTTTSGIAPTMSLPSMVDLKLDEAKIKLTFSRQNVK